MDRKWPIENRDVRDYSDSNQTDETKIRKKTRNKNVKIYRENLKAVLSTTVSASASASASASMAVFRRRDLKRDSWRYVDNAS